MPNPDANKNTTPSADAKPDAGQPADPKRPMLDKSPVAPGCPISHEAPGGQEDKDLQLPHERDQSVSADSTGGMGTGAAKDRQSTVLTQAHDDLKDGQVDTDLRNTPGLDAQRRERLVPEPEPASSPVHRTDRTPVRK